MFVVTKSIHNPLLAPRKEHVAESSWESKASFNPSPARVGGKLHLIYRAIGSSPFEKDAGPSDFSTIGIAESLDGAHFENRRQLLVPEFEWERFGCEDPRATFFEGYWYIFYTALSTYPFSPQGIRVAVAKTKDFKTIEYKRLVTPFNAKAMALFPERVNGKMAAILSLHTDTPPALFTIATFDTEEDLWNEKYWKEWELNSAWNTFDLRRSPEDQVEAGSAPVKTPYGWLLIYSHIQHYWSDHKIFGIEAVLLDIDDPHRVLGRTHGPIIAPSEEYELHGDVPNITFPSGAELIGDTLSIYYGGADTVCARAEVNIHSLIDSMIPERRESLVTRYHKNPTLLPIKENSFEAKAVFNPAAVDLDGSVHLLYRSMSEDNTSYIGYARSSDGFIIDERLSVPAYGPRAEFEKKNVENGNSGCEDPRLMKINERIYMTYTAYNSTSVPRVAISSIRTDDFINKKWNWSDPQLVTGEGIDDKDACIVPAKLPQGYLFIHRINGRVCGAWIPDLDFSKYQIKNCIEIMAPRKGLWDSKRMGIAGPPEKVRWQKQDFWLLFYHGISDHGTYRVGAALLDYNDPTQVVSRCTDFIMEPETDYELYGQIGNVVFPCGQVIREDIIYLYYGGADSVVGVATLSLERLLKILK